MRASQLPTRGARPRSVIAVLGATLGLLVAACTTRSASETTVASVAAARGTTTNPLRWAALGDSYSAGHGGSLSRVTSAAPRCPRAEADSYARRAQALLSDVTIELTFNACGGALVSDLSTQRAGVAGADVVTLTIGGNDAGFFDLTAKCLAGTCPDLVGDDADLPQVASTGDGRTDWQVLADSLEAAFSELLEQMAPGGELLVLTYPLPFPEVSGACPSGLAFVNGDGVIVANATLSRLDDVLVQAAARADQKATDQRHATVLDWRTPSGAPPEVDVTTSSGRTYRLGWNPSGICGDQPMINGLRFDAEPADSFHPTDRGLDLAGALVRDAIERLVGR